MLNTALASGAAHQLSMSMMPAQLSMSLAPLSLSFGMPSFIQPGASTSNSKKASSSGSGATNLEFQGINIPSNNGAATDRTPSTGITNTSARSNAGAIFVASAVVGAGVAAAAVFAVVAKQNNSNEGRLEGSSSSASIATTRPGDIV